MKFLRKHARLIAVAATCAAAGAGIGAIANAGASATAKSAPARTALAGGRRLGGRRLLLRSVHGDLIVRTRAGFASVTFDRGFAQSVSGQQLTLAEGTRGATYRTVTLTIPSSAVVRDNGQRASLSDVKAGQHVIVLQGPKRTFVIARTRR
jgi:hypothetical protein